ncbi:AAA family ATPase [Shimazuella sp. AN120528]|uniref:ATP-binding protein n=1 Tax=Shimazuella soli TaxID=1892854 RepID=UPI001F0FCCF5|nr:ATP-binding protein [Shimazuella soli]MCH5583625.1 AAA family ATPase [Shimazuella soli]
MIIERVHFHGFGCLKQRTIPFEPGLNIIHAPNESGKSTLLRGIYALLYGGAQEGKRVRREADWYAGFRPWLTEQYGGEIDYLLHDIPYRLVRNLSKGREQEQLINRETGEELQQHFLFDQRKERKIMETQIGLSGELFRRTAYITSYSDIGLRFDKEEKKWQQKLAEKLNSLLDQGEEVELSVILGYLDDQLKEIGKTENAKQKPFGMLIEKEKLLQNKLENNKEIQKEYLQARVELQLLLKEQERLEEEYQVLSEQHQRISVSVQCKADWYRLDKIQVALEEWKCTQQLHLDQEKMIQKLEDKRAELEPPFRMQAEDMEECSGLHYQIQTLDKRILQLEQDVQNEQHAAALYRPWWKPIYPMTTFFGILVTIGSFFISAMWGFLFSILMCLIWGIPQVISVYTNKQQEMTRHYNIQISQKLLSQYKAERRVCQERLDWWKNRVGTNDVGVIRKWWDQTQAVEKVEWELEQLLRKQPILKKGEGNYLRQKWVEGKREVVLRYQGAFCHISDNKIDSVSLGLSRETVHKSIQINSMQIGEKKKTVQELELQLHRFQLLQVEWEQVKAQLEQLKEERRAIDVAHEVLQEAYRSRQGNVAPILQQVSSSWIKTVTNNRYDCLYADFSGEGLSARVPETGRAEKIDQLSTGTLMQMVFALKMSIIQYLSSESKHQLPVLLDDCFVYYDKERLASILPLLGKLAKNHQILLCTCHTREIELLDYLGQPYHSISLIS